MSRYYAAHVGPKLKERLGELLDAPLDEAIQLYEELALARMSVQETLKLIDVSMGEKVPQETRALAFSCMTDAIDRVRELVLAVSRIEKDAEDKISLRMLDVFVTQIMRAMQRAIGRDEKLIEKIMTEIDNTVKLPKPREIVSPEGTVITPDQIVQAMDKTIVDLGVD